MRKKFDSFKELAQVFEITATRQLPRMYREILTLYGERTQKEIKDVIIGRTMPLGATGRFQAWPALQEATIEAKRRQGLGKGGNPASMLYATGALHDSIKYTVRVSEKKAYIGSDDDKAEYHEYGTIKIPPRPFIATGAIRAYNKMHDKFEKQFCRTLNGDTTYSR